MNLLHKTLLWIEVQGCHLTCLFLMMLWLGYQPSGVPSYHGKRFFYLFTYLPNLVELITILPCIILCSSNDGIRPIEAAVYMQWNDLKMYFWISSSSWIDCFGRSFQAFFLWLWLSEHERIRRRWLTKFQLVYNKDG